MHSSLKTRDPHHSRQDEKGRLLTRLFVGWQALRPLPLPPAGRVWSVWSD